MMNLIECGDPRRWAGIHSHLTIGVIPIDLRARSLCGNSQHFSHVGGGFLMPKTPDSLAEFGDRMVPLAEYIQRLEEALIKSGIEYQHVYVRVRKSIPLYMSAGVFFHSGRASVEATYYQAHYPEAQVVTFRDRGAWESEERRNAARLN